MSEEPKDPQIGDAGNVSPPPEGRGDDGMLDLSATPEPQKKEAAPASDPKIGAEPASDQKIGAEPASDPKIGAEPETKAPTLEKPLRPQPALRVPKVRVVEKSEPKSRSFFLGGFPLVILILGLLTIGSCHYTVNEFTAGFNKISDNSLSEPGIAVLIIQGEIFSTEWAIEAVERFNEDDNVKALVIRIDSPGGAVAPCQELYEALNKFKKPKIVSMGSIAASGGYYIAVTADIIFANRGTITGSIGVIMQALEFSEAMEKFGVKGIVIKSGEFKDSGSPFRAMRPDEMEVLQSMVMNVYEQFVQDVMAGRSLMTEEAVRALADGRVYSGEEARMLGLVDQLGGLSDAVRHAQVLAKLPLDKEPKIIYEDGQSSFFSQLFGEAFSFLEPVKSTFTPGITMKFIYLPGL